MRSSLPRIRIEDSFYIFISVSFLFEYNTIKIVQRIIIIIIWFKLFVLSLLWHLAQFRFSVCYGLNDLVLRAREWKWKMRKSEKGKTWLSLVIFLQIDNIRQKQLKIELNLNDPVRLDASVWCLVNQIANFVNIVRL